MARSFKPGILVTVSAGGLLACSGIADKLGGDGPKIGNPPYIPDATFPTRPFVLGQALEPRDRNSQQIHHGSGSCWIDLPFEETPTSWRPSPREPVDCPPAMLTDPAWGECNGGTLSIKTLSPQLTCVCYFDGNPPRPPQAVSCPVSSVPDLMLAASEG